MTIALKARLTALETVKPSAKIITYFTGKDGTQWQNNGGLCTPCSISQEQWEERTAAQQTKLINLL